MCGYSQMTISNTDLTEEVVSFTFAAMTPRKTQRTRRIAPASVTSGTRERLLETAGHVFAEKGFDRATAKEIARRAGTNAAAVNYYFGGIDPLYSAVLEDARERILSLDEMLAVASRETDPKAKFLLMMELIVRALTGPSSSSWMVRVFAREYLAPTNMLARLNRQKTEKRLGLLKGIVAGVMGLPTDDCAVSFGCVSVIAPCILLLVADPDMIERVFPDIALRADNAPALAQCLTQYALGGLAALARSRHAASRRAAAE